VNFIDILNFGILGCDNNHSNGIEDLATLSVRECSSYLHGPQKLEVYLYPTRSKYEAKKMAHVDQGL
jgi:hypothetical protein